MDECTPPLGGGQIFRNLSRDELTRDLRNATTHRSTNYTYSPAPKGIVQTHRIAEIIEDVVYHNFIVGICAFGLIGNIVNLVVLSRRSLTRTMERLERSAHYGLMGLAVSDALFCTSVLPTAYVSHRVFGFGSYDFRIVYATYGAAVINTFILSSTWLTVTMALGRYLAICYPFHARLFIGRRFAVSSLVIVFCVCVFMNAPRYFVERIVAIPCEEGGSFYYKDFGILGRNQFLRTVYYYVYFFVGIVVPFLILAFCNANLIGALHTSMSMRKEGHVTYGGGSQSAANRITLTLIVIVAMFLFLVVPAEIMTFLRDAVVQNVGYLEVYNLALAFLNLFQAVNFAVNFLLYCVVNARFRKTLWRLVVAILFCRRHGLCAGKYRRSECHASTFRAASRKYVSGRTTLETSTTL